MKRPAIFFDRDNTLIVSDGYLGDPSQVRLVAGAADAVARARRLGYAVVVISNQSGVARGMFSEDDVRAVNARLDELLKASNAEAVIDRHEFCPYHPEATVEAYRRDSDLRKPNPGMIYAAAQALALDLSRSWVIGDAPRDVAAGHAAGCRTILLRDESLAASPAATAPQIMQADANVKTLSEAIEFVASAPARTSADRDTPGRPEDEDEIPAAFVPPREDSSNPESHGSKGPNGARAATTTIRVAAALKPVAPKLAMPLTPAPAAPAPRLVREQPEPPAAGARDDQPSTARLESLVDQVVHELRRRRELEEHAEFSVTKLLGGIVQVMSIAVVFLAYLNRNDASFVPLLIFAVWVQCLTIALLVMGRQR